MKDKACTAGGSVLTPTLAMLVALLRARGGSGSSLPLAARLLAAVTPPASAQLAAIKALR